MKTWRVVTAGIVLFLALTVLFGYLFMTRSRPEMVVATWPESYGHAQASAQLVPFGNVSGTNVRIAIYDGGIEELRQQVASGHYKWDVMDLEARDAAAACADGLLEPIAAADLPASPNGAPATEDFVPGAIGPCWVASVIYAQVVALAPSSFGDHPPTQSADFFDVKRYPGKRALNGSAAKYNLEMALLADGVAAKDVYKMLATPAGVTRAIAKLGTIKRDILWYKTPSEATKMLSDGRASMALLPNWAVFDADNDPDAHFKLPILWDRQLYEVEAFGIPKGNPKAKAAFDFVRFATKTENLGRMASWIAYGPARRSALGFVSTNPDLKIAMPPYLPTAHFDTAFAVDENFWRQHGASIAASWQSFAGTP